MQAEQVLNNISSGLGLIGNVNPTVKAGYIYGQVAATAITTISNISDQAQRSNLTNAYNNLSTAQQNDINTKISNANDQLSKLQILSNSLTYYELANRNNLQEKNIRNTLLIVGSISLLILLMAYLKK